MKGTTLIYRPGGAAPEVATHTATPPLEFLQAAVGGWIEAVPDFASIEVDGAVFLCVAFCNEEGKLTEPPMLLNNRAMILWDRALRRLTDDDGKPVYPNGLLRPNGNPTDVLVGPIIVVTGDAEFMRSL
jgi:hypothetical protein